MTDLRTDAPDEAQMQGHTPFDVELIPQQQSGRGHSTVRLRVANHQLEQLDLQLAAQHGDALQVGFVESNTSTLAPEETQDVLVSIAPRDWRLFGPEQSHDFTLTARSTSDSVEPRAAQGRFTYRPLLSGIAPAVALALGAVILIAALVVPVRALTSTLFGGPGITTSCSAKPGSPLQLAFHIASSGLPGELGSFTIGSGLASIAVNSATHNIYLVSQGDSTLRVVDGKNYTQLCQVQLDSPGVFAAVNSATNRVYVSNPGRDKIDVIDGSSSRVVARIDMREAALLYIDSKANLIFVLHPRAAVVSVIDGTASRLASEIRLDDIPSVAALDSTSHRLYLAVGRSILVVNTLTNAVLTRFQVANSPTAMDIDPTLGILYVGDTAASKVLALDPQSGETKSTLSLDNATFDLRAVPGSGRFITDTVRCASSAPNDCIGYAYVTDFATAATSSISAISGAFTVPGQIGIDESAHLGYVVETSDNTVHVIGPVTGFTKVKGLVSMKVAGQAPSVAFNGTLDNNRDGMPPVNTTCAAIGLSGGPPHDSTSTASFALPAVLAYEGGSQVTFDFSGVRLNSYSGPGHYGPDSTQGSDLTITLADGSTVEATSDTAQFAADIGADGSGRVKLDGQTKAGSPISGSIEWSCADVAA